MKIKLLILVCVMAFLMTACQIDNGYPFGHPCNEIEMIFSDSCP